MDKLNIDIHNILNIFYKATGIQAVFYDTDLNPITNQTEKKAACDFSIFGMNEISAYLADIFSKSPIDDSIFYTYFLPNNFICNIAFAIKDNRYIGAFVTNPVLVKRIDKDEVDKLFTPNEDVVKNKRIIEKILSKVPVIQYEKIMPLGYVLCQLAKTLFQKETQQILQSSTLKPKANILNKRYSNENSFHNPSDEDYDPLLYDFLKLTELIRNGDTELIRSTLNNVSAAQLSVHQIYGLDFFRSLKNSFIKICSIAAYIAIEAKASHEKVTEVYDEYILEIENSEDINDIYGLMKSALISFTNIVARSKHNTYSKYVRMAMEYVEHHYSEKITLQMIAQYTKISTFYLSRQIKNETGLNLLDNVNKIRIEKSKEFLINTNISILDIAQRVGFNYQNHFAVIFKKFTGFSPNDFRKNLGKPNDLDKKKACPDGEASTLIERIYIKLEMLSTLFDEARIVNPLNHTFIKVNSEFNSHVSELCKKSGNHNHYCKSCISKIAYMHNDVIVKIYSKHQKTTLALAIPISLGKTTYVVEIVKDVTNRILSTSKYLYNDLIASNYCTAEKDELTGLYNRGFIDKRLPMDMRLSILERKSLLIIIFTIEISTSIMEYENGVHALKELAGVLSDSFVNIKDWAGRYSGNMFLLVLNEITYDIAFKIAENIKKKFNNILLNLIEDETCFAINYGVKSYSQVISNSETFIKHAFINMNKNKMEE